MRRFKNRAKPGPRFTCAGCGNVTGLVFRNLRTNDGYCSLACLHLKETEDAPGTQEAGDA